MNVYYTIQFKKDYKRIKKQNKDLDKLRKIIELLSTGQVLDEKYHDHPLSGKWKKHRDCHIEPDWILIYRKSSDSIFFERTGSHSDLFK
ncbi:type II toxin-antitoxin system YafQ family toxin [candidate division KSB1 bacterium]|nr:type II toxin-antitoxin system YafQ family toxin [candidate division KSB1 bacterium]RQW02907.1 MAG: type II toxin-antitoxin system YafQ family toxin [candidate division KSB1 bacterium]